MMNDWNGFGGWGRGLGFIFMWLLRGLVILGIAALIRRLMTKSLRTLGLRDKSPLEITQERYAHCEIETTNLSSKCATSGRKHGIRKHESADLSRLQRDHAAGAGRGRCVPTVWSCTSAILRRRMYMVFQAGKPSLTHEHR